MLNDNEFMQRCDKLVISEDGEVRNTEPSQNVLKWKGRNQKHAEQPFKIAHIDYIKLDLEVVDSLTGKNLGRPWLALLVDDYSRWPLAYKTTLDIPSYHSHMMVLSECVRRFNKLPEIVITDRGCDFESKHFQSLLARYNVMHKCRPTNTAGFGAIIERWYATVNSALSCNLGDSTNKGGIPQVTSSANQENSTKCTLPELSELCREYFYKSNDSSDYTSLCEPPLNAFDQEK